MLLDHKTHIDPVTANKTPLIVGNYYRFRNEKTGDLCLCEYLGEFDSIREVPAKYGFFILNGETKQYFMKYLDEEAYNKAMDAYNKTRAKPPKSKESLLDCSTSTRDDELKIMIKRALDGMTHDEFKALFDNITVANNMKGAIFGDKDLSWKRFSEMCRLLGCTYNLEIVKEDKVIKNIDEGDINE